MSSVVLRREPPCDPKTLGVHLDQRREIEHIWTHPALQGQCLLMAVRGTTARIYPASFLEGRGPLRHDGICALPPQHFDDLTMVFVITRLRTSRSDLSRHQAILPYATVWKGLYSVNTCAMHLLRCSPQVLSCRCAPPKGPTSPFPTGASALLVARTHSGRGAIPLPLRE